MKWMELMKDISYRLEGNAALDAQHTASKRVTSDHTLAGADVLYVCTHTPVRDGHDTAYAAYAAGSRVFVAERSLKLPLDATVFLVENANRELGRLAARCLGHPARQMTVIGITGTVGKSSVAYTLTMLLRRAGYSVATLTEDGAWIDGTLHPSGPKVPDGAMIQELLRRFADAGAEFAVLEISSYMLAQNSAVSIPFAAVLVTEHRPAHADSGEDRPYDCCASEHLAQLAGGTPFWVCSVDFAEEIRRIVPSHTRILTVGEGGDLFAENAQRFVGKKGYGTQFSLCFENGACEAVSLPVPGDFAVKNAVCAAALARVAGLSPGQIAKNLSDYMPPGRMECIGFCRGRWIYADTAYDAPALARALGVLRPYTEGRLTVLLGSVGGRNRARRGPLGKTAVDDGDFAYFTADNPDHEAVPQICADLAEEVSDPARYAVIPDRREAIIQAILEMRPGDVLLLAGKGNENYQFIRGRRETFSERTIVKEAVAML